MSDEYEPLISIIIPTYNRAHLIGETIESILAQSYARWEMLIVDDGSTDNTENVVKEISDSRISYFHREHIGNLAVLHNFGISKSKGALIAFADSDDLWRADKLAFQVKLFQQNPSGQFIISNGEIFGSDIASPPDYEELFVGSLFWPILEEKRFVFYTPTWIFKKEILGTLGAMQQNLKGGTDLNFFLHMSASYDGIFTNERLVRIRKHINNSTGDSSTSVNLYQNAIGVIQEFYTKKQLTEKQYHALAHKYNYKLGILYFKDRTYREAVVYFSRCIKILPSHWKSYVRLLHCKFLLLSMTNQSR